MIVWFKTLLALTLNALLSSMYRSAMNCSQLNLKALNGCVIRISEKQSIRALLRGLVFLSMLSVFVSSILARNRGPLNRFFHAFLSLSSNFSTWVLIGLEQEFIKFRLEELQLIEKINIYYKTLNYAFYLYLLFHIFYFWDRNWSNKTRHSCSWLKPQLRFDP